MAVYQQRLERKNGQRTPFFEWLRTNAEEYLLEAAEEEMAQRYLRRGARVGKDTKRGGWFWRRVFVPAYRLMPWPVRRAMMVSMPGSHKQQWSWQAFGEAPRREPDSAIRRALAGRRGKLLVGALVVAAPAALWLRRAKDGRGRRRLEGVFTSRRR